MNIDTDLKRLLSYQQSLDGSAFCRNVLRAVEQQQKQRRWIMGVFFILGCITALSVLLFFLPAKAITIAPNMLSLYAAVGVGCFILWVIFEEFELIR